MGFGDRGRGGGGFRGGGGGGRGRGGGGGRGFGGRGGGRGGGGRGGFNRYDQGPPDHVVEVAEFSHSCENDLVVRATVKDVPYFNAPIFLENKQQIGKVDEILGQVQDYYFSVKLGDNMNSRSFKVKDKVFIDPNKLLPLARFLPGAKPPGRGGRGGRGGGRGRGGPRGGGRGGGFRGGRGGGDRGGRGGFRGRGGGGGGFRGRGGGGGFRGR